MSHFFGIGSKNQNKNTFENKNLTEFFKEIIKDSLDRLAYPSIKNEVRNIYTEKAEEEVINIFSENLEKLLLQPPLSKKTLMGLDPGYRTGCKMVIINKDGFYETNDVLFLVDGVHNERQLAAAKKKILDYIAKYDVDIIAIGNGTASRETEAFVADVIKDSKKKVSYNKATIQGTYFRICACFYLYLYRNYCHRSG